MATSSARLEEAQMDPLRWILAHLEEKGQGQIWKEQPCKDKGKGKSDQKGQDSKGKSKKGKTENEKRSICGKQHAVKDCWYNGKNKIPSQKKVGKATGHQP